jgi:hypothetical protein
MYQGGPLDFGVTPTIKRFNGAYELTSSPKYYVEFEGAGHFAWTDLNPIFQPIINQYSLAFFDRYLKVTSSDTLASMLTTPPPKRVNYLRQSDTDESQVVSH